MIIEITGAAGVGKSTAVKKCCQEMQQSGYATIPFSDELVLERFKLGFMRAWPMRGVMADMVLLLLFLRHRRKYRTIIQHAKDSLRPIDESNYVKINIVRNLILRIARHEFIRNYLNEAIVIVDEGISHIPYTLINYADADYVSDIKSDLEYFAVLVERLFKTIDVIILVRDPASILESILNRGHKRISSHTKYTAARFVAYNYQLSLAYVDLSNSFFRSKETYQLDRHGRNKHGTLTQLITRVSSK